MLHVITVYATFYRTGMVVLLHCPMKIPRVGTGLIPSHFPIVSHPKPCSYSWQFNILTYILKNEKRQGGRVTGWQCPFPLKQLRFCPPYFSICSQPAASYLVTMMPRQTGKYVCSYNSGNASPQKKNKWKSEYSLHSATTCSWGTWNTQAQPDRELSVLQYLRCSRLENNPHMAIKMPSKMAGVGKHNNH